MYCRAPYEKLVDPPRLLVPSLVCQIPLRFYRLGTTLSYADLHHLAIHEAYLCNYHM
eukprot:10525.XXX_254876_255046_1 [CDS] Oithona nana genome sequencing.